MLTGQVTIVKRDSKTLEIIDTIMQLNHVTEVTIEDFCNKGTEAFGDNVFIGMRNQELDPFVDIVTKSITGTVPGGISSPATYFERPLPQTYAQWINRFSAPASDRTIYLIGLTKDTAISGDHHINATAYLKLTTPCVQTSTEILDVYYRVSFNSDTLSDLQLETLLFKLWNDNDNTNFNNQRLYPEYPAVSSFTPTDALSSVPYVVERQGHGSVRVDNGGSFTDVDLVSHSDDTTAYLRRRNYVTSPRTGEMTGKIIGSVGHTGMFGNLDGANNLGYVPFHVNFAGPDNSGVQSTIRHHNTSTTPFYDPSIQALGRGLVQVDDTSWTNPSFPKMYRFDFFNTGGTGTAEYTFRERNVLGFHGNTYNDAHQAIPYLNEEAKSYFDNIDIFTGSTEFAQKYGANIKPYDEKHILIFEANYIIKLNLMTGHRTIWNNDTLGISWSNIGQIAIDSTGNVWVGCRSTGLYKIDVSSNLAEHFAYRGTNCYAVNVGKSDKIWAITEIGLHMTQNYGLTWTEYNALTSPTFDIGLTPNVVWLVCDEVSNDSNLAIGYVTDVPSVSRTVNVRWWDTVNGSVGSNDIIPLTTIPVGEDYPFAPRELQEMMKWTLMGGFATACATQNADCPAYFSYNSATPNVTCGTPTLGSPSKYKTYLGLDSSGTQAIVFSYNNPNMLPFGSFGTYYVENFWGLARLNGSFVLSDMLNDPNYVPPNEPVDLNGFSRSSLTYLGRGVFIMSNARSAPPQNPDVQKGWCIIASGGEDHPTSGSFEKEIWREYGWIGYWAPRGEIITLPGVIPSKPTHSGFEPITDGLLVAFDDDGGAEQFVDGEYNTVGVMKGLWLDETVEADHTYHLYYKKAFTNNTIFSEGTLPLAQNRVEVIKEPMQINWIDLYFTTFDEINNIVTSTATTGPTVSGSGIRTMSTITTSGSIQFKLSATDPLCQFGVGLSSGQTGQSVDVNAIDYCFFVNGEGDVSIRENGTTVWTATDATWSLATAPDELFKIVRDGTAIQYLYRNEIVYTSTNLAASPLNVDIAMGETGSVKEITYRQDPVDYFIRFGSSQTSTGWYHPHFFAVDPDYSAGFSFQVNGVEATQIGLRDTNTPLASGEISVFPEDGAIRYSAFDVNNPVTGTYTYLSSDGAGTSVSFTWTQTIPVTSVVINHNLGYYPIVRVFSNDFEIQPLHIIHHSINTVEIQFTAPTAFIARMM